MNLVCDKLITDPDYLMIYSTASTLKQIHSIRKSHVIAVSEYQDQLALHLVTGETWILRPPADWVDEATRKIFRWWTGGDGRFRDAPTLRSITLEQESTDAS